MTLGRKHCKPVDFMPKTVAEAVDRLVSVLSDDDKALVPRTEKADLIRFHGSWGMGIRNRFGLWGENQALISSIPSEHRWADESSMLIIEAAWERLRGESTDS